MKKKQKDKNIRVDPEVYKMAKLIGIETNRKLKAVVAIAVYDLSKTLK